MREGANIRTTKRSMRFACTGTRRIVTQWNHLLPVLENINTTNLLEEALSLAKNVS